MFNNLNTFVDLASGRTLTAQGCAALLRVIWELNNPDGMTLMAWRSSVAKRLRAVGLMPAGNFTNRQLVEAIIASGAVAPKVTIY